MRSRYGPILAEARVYTTDYSYNAVCRSVLRSGGAMVSGANRPEDNSGNSTFNFPPMPHLEGSDVEYTDEVPKDMRIELTQVIAFMGVTSPSRRCQGRNLRPPG